MTNMKWLKDKSKGNGFDVKKREFEVTRCELTGQTVLTQSTSEEFQQHVRPRLEAVLQRKSFCAGYKT